MKKRIATVLLFVLLLCVFCSCGLFGNDPTPPPLQPDEKPGVDPAPDDGKDDVPSLKQSKVQFSLPPTGVETYAGAVVKVENEVLPLYKVKVNNEHSWQPNPTESRSDSGAGLFFLEGKTQVSVSVDGMKSCVVRPLSANVLPKTENGTATFTLSSAGQYSVEPDGDPEKAVFLFVSDMSKKTPEVKTNNVIRFEKGLHTQDTDSRIVNGTVTLNSNTTVVLEDGAVVRARFVANNADNVTICGTGVIDGSSFVRNASTGEVTVPLDFNYCTNVTFKDFSVFDPAGWCVNWYFCSDGEIDSIKIITSRSNGDGISLQSCKRINVFNSFVRGWDDNLVVKNYPQWSNKNNEGATENITFSNCVLWTDLAQSMEVGYETVGKTMKDITFENITVLHNFHKPVMSVHNGNNADIKNVVFDGVTVEDASMGRGDAGQNNQLCEFSVEFSSTWSLGHKETALGSIDGVTVKNVTVLSGNSVISLRVAGSRDLRSGYGQSIHRADNVVFENVWLQTKQLTRSYSRLSVNEYASVSVESGDARYVVPFAFSLTEQEIGSYTDNASVAVN